VIRLFLLSLLLLGCSRINQKERAYYDERSFMRHGIVPLEQKDGETKEVQQKFDAQSVARGKMLYEKNCLGCHGADGTGNGPDAAKQKYPPANLKQTVKDVPRFTFYLSVSQWQGEMPGWKTPYSAQDREDLAAYIRTFAN
jgi:mono/diheme cytochrome c family protein